MKLEFSRQVFQKYSYFMKIRPVGAEVIHADGQTDRHDEANSCISQLRERAWNVLRLYTHLKEQFTYTNI